MRLAERNRTPFMPIRQQERRKMARLALEVPVKISVPGTRTQLFAETRNVSAQGIYFRTPATTFEIGQEVDCVLVLPEKLTMASKPSFVNCRGRVVRLTHGLPDDNVGVALEVNSFDFSMQNFSPLSAYHT
jgi:hypothetical protein